jgi:hypothetical protein
MRSPEEKGKGIERRMAGRCFLLLCMRAHACVCVGGGVGGVGHYMTTMKMGTLLKDRLSELFFNGYERNPSYNPSNC